jgi:hypothetical protein
MRSGVFDDGMVSSEQVLLDFNYAGTLLFAGHERQGLDLVRRANRQALALGDPGLALSTALGAACSNWIAGSAREGFEVADRALGLAGDDPTMGRGW